MAGAKAQDVGTGTARLTRKALTALGAREGDVVEVRGKRLTACVADAAELERFALLGISQGGAFSIRYAVEHPERVTCLIILGGYLRGRLMRVVPRPNEAINETWIADRDRFSYEGIYADDRLMTPMVKRNGTWQSESWETALAMVSSSLRDVIARHGPASVGGLASPSSTLEELHLFARIVRGLGSPHLDHRLRQQDFRDQEADPLYPSLGMPIADFERVNTLLVVGCNLRREAPILAHRIRKAATRHGARVSFLNQRQHQYFFPVSHYLTAAEGEIAAALAGLISATAQGAKKAIPEHVRQVAADVRPPHLEQPLA